MNESKNNCLPANNELLHSRPEGFFRIQKSSEYAQFCDKPKYLESAQIEVRPFAIYVKKLFGKRVAEARRPLIAGHLHEANKGYPEGFKNYLTYDERRERDFKDNHKD